MINQAREITERSRKTEEKKKRRKRSIEALAYLSTPSLFESNDYYNVSVVRTLLNFAFYPTQFCNLHLGSF